MEYAVLAQPTLLVKFHNIDSCICREYAGAVEYDAKKPIRARNYLCDEATTYVMALRCY